MRLIDADKLERQEFDGEEACFDYVDAEDIDNRREKGLWRCRSVIPSGRGF